MGRRASTETIATLLVAFLEHPVWGQADLARRCGLTPRALKLRIIELQEAGVPITKDDEESDHVYWTVKRGWFPSEGTGLERIDRYVLARLVSRLESSSLREQVLGKLIVPAFGPPIEANDRPRKESEDVLATLEDAVKKRRVVRMGYHSARSTPAKVRCVSVQRIEYGDRLRFIAFCHESSTLKWFRVERVTSPRLDGSVAFVPVERTDVERLLAESLDGFRGSGEAIACEFRVRSSEARWVIDNLPRGTGSAVVARDEERWTVTLQTSAVEVLARFLVGLGGVVEVVSPKSLRRRVRAIAQESLLIHGRVGGRNVKSVQYRIVQSDEGR